MSDDERIATKLDQHFEKLAHLETRQSVSDERHHRHDKRIQNLETNWSWIIKTVAAIIIGGILTAYLKGTAF